MSWSCRPVIISSMPGRRRRKRRVSQTSKRPRAVLNDNCAPFIYVTAYHLSTGISKYKDYYIIYVYIMIRPICLETSDT